MTSTVLTTKRRAEKYHASLHSHLKHVSCGVRWNKQHMLLSTSETTHQWMWTGLWSKLFNGFALIQVAAGCQIRSGIGSAKITTSNHRIH